MSEVGAEECRIQVGDFPINTFTEYEVRLGVFDQPCAFSMSLGSGELASSLLPRLRYNSPFQLTIAGRRQFAGYTDGFQLNVKSSATEVTVFGRDIVARLSDSFHEKDASYVAASHRDVIEKALIELDVVKPFSGGARPTIIGSNAETRYSRTGNNGLADNDEYETELQRPVGTVGNAVVTLRAKTGERWLDLILRHLKQDGLFIWSSTNGDLIVGRPNYHQAPCVRIIRARDQFPRINTVLSTRYRVDLKPMYSEVAIYGRTSGKKYARTTAKGAYTDDVLVDQGVHKVLVLHDVDVTSTASAEAIARRHLSEGRREGFLLEYEFAGHTATGIGGGTIVWGPDIVVDVQDDELGIHESMWVESVTHRRKNGGTTSTIRLLSADALIFSDEVVNEPYFLSGDAKSTTQNAQGRRPVSITVINEDTRKANLPNGVRIPTGQTINGKARDLGQNDPVGKKPK